jgi:hypothetical protein
MRRLLSVALTGVLGALTVSRASTVGVSADYMLLVCIGALTCSLAVLIGSFRARDPEWRAAVDDGGAPTLDRARTLRLSAFAVTWILYVLILPNVGFIVSTWLGLVAALALLSGRPGLRQAAGLAVFVLVFFVLISAVLFVPVPRGFVDNEIEELIYSLR